MKKGVQLVICPKCSQAFPIDKIVEHVLSHSGKSSEPAKPQERDMKSTGA